MQAAKIVDAILWSDREAGKLVEIEAGEQNLTVYYAHDPGAAELIAHLFSSHTKGCGILVGQGFAIGVF